LTLLSALSKLHTFFVAWFPFSWIPDSLAQSAQCGLCKMKTSEEVRPSGTRSNIAGPEPCIKRDNRMETALLPKQQDKRRAQNATVQTHGSATILTEVTFIHDASTCDQDSAHVHAPLQNAQPVNYINYSRDKKYAGHEDLISHLGNAGSTQLSNCSADKLAVLHSLPFIHHTSPAWLYNEPNNLLSLKLTPHTSLLPPPPLTNT
jgi:hypothetical protein